MEELGRAAMTAFQKLALLASGATPRVTFNVAEAQEITRAIKQAKPNRKKRAP